MMPMRAIMVGPLSSTTRSKASTAALPLLEQLLGRGELLDIFGGVLEDDELATAPSLGQRLRQFVLGVHR